MSNTRDVPTILTSTRGDVLHSPPTGAEPRFTASSLVQKRAFTLPSYTTAGGAHLGPVPIGYECYGQLNDARDNAILVLHYFTGTSHAAGRYHAEDVEAGYWDALIGPGKAIDTDRFFVIGVDSLCNLNALHPLVVSLTPRSLDPNTGRPYGAEFPVIRITDMVRVQRELLRHLGIEKLHAVVGPSMGSMQALEWAAEFPDLVPRVFGAIGGGVATEAYLIAWLRQWCAPILLDPKFQGGRYEVGDPPLDGLSAALELVTITALSPAWAGRIFARQPADRKSPPEEKLENLFSVERALAGTARARAELTDANAFLRLAKAVQLYDIRDRVQRIRARVLWATVNSDLLILPEYSTRGVQDLRKAGVSVDTVSLPTEGGHLDGLHFAGKFAESLRGFLNS